MELLGRNTLLDAIFEIGRKMSCKLLVPLTVIITYKGFTAFVETNMELDQKQLSYGNQGNSFHSDSEIIEDLALIGRLLRIKPHNSKNRNNTAALTNVAISHQLKIYKIEKNSLENLLAEKVPNFGKEATIELKEEDEETDEKQCAYYITEASNIFPLDIDEEKKTRFLKRHRLRPEFLRKYEKRLNPDSFDKKKSSKQYEYHEIEVTDANKFLKSNVLRKLVKSLDKMEFLPLNSQGFGKIFHKFGANIRYLGEITQLTKLPHIKELCITEMIARASKKILSLVLSNMIFNAGRVANEAANANINLGFLEVEKEASIKEFDLQIKIKIAQALNLIFGKSANASQFLESELKPQIFYDYNYKLHSKFEISTLPLGYMLQACSFHFCIKLKEKKFELTSGEEKIFKFSDILSFDFKEKSFTLEKHKLRLITEFYEHHREKKIIRLV